MLRHKMASLTQTQAKDIVRTIVWCMMLQYTDLFVYTQTWHDILVWVSISSNDRALDVCACVFLTDQLIGPVGFLPAAAWTACLHPYSEVFLVQRY